jgi:hypothetical protein
VKILPPITHPWPERIARRHVPKPSVAEYGYRTYRPCLRWEFGFSCGFCLVHEMDLSLAVGRALMETEHFIPVHVRPDLANSYGNCFHACHACNHQRGTQPNRGPLGERLLNACDDLWEDHFEVVADEIRPRDRDPDATYTCDVYDLNDPAKVRMRQLRRKIIAAGLRAVEARALSVELREQDAALEEVDPDSLARRDEQLLASQRLWSLYEMFMEQLSWYAPVPWDADPLCRCESLSEDSELPTVLAVQLIDVDLP